LPSIVFNFITHRSTGRQKQARFLPLGKLLAKERHHFKRKTFFAFAACELNVIVRKLVTLKAETKI
jgi:hypothetical protein